LKEFTVNFLPNGIIFDIIIAIFSKPW
jgi:hypothetical protein